MNKYFQVFNFNLKAQFNFKANYLFSLFSFAIHILVFSSLWNYILKDKLLFGYSKLDLIWYVIMGEFIIYTTTHNYKRISEMVKNGDIANMLTKPITFAFYLFAEELASIVKVFANLLFAITLGILMAGVIDMSFTQLIYIIISSSISIVLILLIEIIIGLLAFLTEENEPFYLLISKAMLIVVFAPLDFFPSMAQKVLTFLPTTYIIYSPAKLLVHYDVNQVSWLLSSQVLSLIFFVILIYILSKKGVQNINVNGG